ncbi:hypothetical protein GMES_1043 [Paraglaciecola mesophila KMM 241]|uniref:Polysaccharide biosynthesis protein n=1 Tax=Paraglaciecola mesophila KMM 241 TaxID=1128912 RepID=K6YYX0_9ALTE|nr:oligosaccharide flippase family protein [Paraglaciecola mesophila]GAC23342.1 hypothetical protein GMES_1043 [Paraglaciecola mesophila KMM 241]
MNKKWFGLERILLLSNDSFIKNIFVLITGTASVQVLNFALTPLITRLYSAEEFGALGLFSSILSLLIVISALSYPIAIVFVKEEQKYKRLVSISLKLMLITGAALFLLSLLSLNLFVFSFNDILWYLFLGFFPASITAIYSQILLRNKKFKTIAYIGFSSAIAVATTKIISGLYYPSSTSLILSAILGFLVSLTAMHFVIFGKSIKFEIPVFNIRERLLMRELQQFPLYRLPHSFNAALSQIVPVTLLTSYFGLKAAGYFVLTRSVLMVPVTLLGKAVYDVAYPKISADFGNKPITKFLIYSTCGLLGISLIPLLILLFWGQELFSLIFGHDWSRAGLYASCMSFWFVFNVSNRPSVAAVSFLGLDKLLLINGVISLSLSTLGFLVAYYVWGTDTAAISAFFLCAIFLQVFLISNVLIASGKSDKSLSTIN